MAAAATGKQKSVQRSASASKSQHTKKNEYKIDSDPRGCCLIINNENFVKMLKKREGSQNDVESLKNLFEFLAFKVEVEEDKSANEMKELMTKYSKDCYGDCFVCCIMSHGNEHGVTGSDGEPCALNDIILPFNGDTCSALLGKPKLFFIQACRGKEEQKKLKVYEDVSGGYPGNDSGRLFYTIGQSSDFLISLSTVEGYVSLRNPATGSGFIQSLCKHLKEGSKGDLDILKILTQVNDDVSKMEGGSKKKMTPVTYYTLRKPLILRPTE